MPAMPHFLLVMIGGAIGAGLRHGVGLALPPSASGWPWGTFAVNLAGGLGAGLLLGALAGRGVEAEPLRLFLGVGLLGGFTTFSAFSAEAAGMLARGEPVFFLLYILASVAGALALLFLGLQLARPA